MPLPRMKLSAIGLEVEKSIGFIHEKYGCIYKYVIMPNHVHLLIEIVQKDGTSSLSMQDLVRRMKSFTTLQYNQIRGVNTGCLWQRSFHDHVIRNEQSYQEICQYIETNPLKWAMDKYHVT